MGTLKQIEQGSGLRSVIERAPTSKVDDGLGMGRKMVLNGLALERTHDAKTNSTADPTAHLHENKQAKHGIAIQIQRTCDGAEDGGEMTGQFVM